MTTEITPNVVISDPSTRKQIGITLYVVSLLAGIAALLFAFFPELAYGTDIPTRAIAFVNGVVALLSGGFGLVVTVPNVPSASQSDSVRDAIAATESGLTPSEKEADEQAALSRRQLRNQ